MKRKNVEVVFESKLDRNIHVTTWTNNPKGRQKRMLQNIRACQANGGIGDWAKFSRFECFANTDANDIDVYIRKSI